MRQQLILASVCYVTMASCSGQNLKSQNVQGDQGSKPNTTVQPKDGNTSNGSVLSDQASGGKEIAGSFLTQCEVFSPTEVGCNMYQKTSETSVRKFDQSYKQILVLNRNPREEIRRDEKLSRASTAYQNVYVFNSSQLEYMKSNSKKVDLVFSEVSGVGNVDFKTMVSFETTSLSRATIGGAAMTYRDILPSESKESDWLHSKQFVVDASFYCENSDFGYSAKNGILKVKVKSTTVGDVRFKLNNSDPVPQDAVTHKDIDGVRYQYYAFGFGKLDKGAILRFDGAPLDGPNGFVLLMKNTDHFTNCTFKKQQVDTTNPLSSMLYAFSSIVTSTLKVLSIQPD